MDKKPGCSTKMSNCIPAPVGGKISQGEEPQWVKTVTWQAD